MTMRQARASRPRNQIDFGIQASLSIHAAATTPTITVAVGDPVRQLDPAHHRKQEAAEHRQHEDERQQADAQRQRAEEERREHEDDRVGAAEVRLAEGAARPRDDWPCSWRRRAGRRARGRSPRRRSPPAGSSSGVAAATSRPARLASMPPSRFEWTRLEGRQGECHAYQHPRPGREIERLGRCCQRASVSRVGMMTWSVPERPVRAATPRDASPCPRTSTRTDWS